MAKVIVTATGDYEIALAWIDLKGMALNDGVGEMDLPPGEHALTWVIIGKPGQKGQWKVTVDGGVAGSGSGTIKAGKSAASGHIDFQIGGS